MESRPICNPEQEPVAAAKTPPRRSLSLKGEGFHCKFCDTHTAYRSHRKNALEFFRTRLTGKVPFRCYRCLRRFWATIDPRDI